jgi:hypothetical protein
MSRHAAQTGQHRSIPPTSARLALWLTEGRIGRGALIIGCAIGLTIPALSDATLSAGEFVGGAAASVTDR